MTEIDLLRQSSFLWCDLFGDDGSLMATGFNAWAGVFYLDGHWHAVGGGKALPTQRLAIGERLVCLAQADDFLNTPRNRGCRAQDPVLAEPAGDRSSNCAICRRTTGRTSA